MLYVIPLPTILYCVSAKYCKPIRDVFFKVCLLMIVNMIHLKTSIFKEENNELYTCFHKVSYYYAITEVILDYI